MHDTDPQNNKISFENTASLADYGDILADTTSENQGKKASGSGNQGKVSSGNQAPLTNAEYMQQVIHDDFKRIVDDMRAFRVDHYDQVVQNKCLTGVKQAMSRRWVVFYQNMINVDIFSLYAATAATREGRKPTLQLSKLILASHLSKQDKLDA